MPTASVPGGSSFCAKKEKTLDELRKSTNRGRTKMMVSAKVYPFPVFIMTTATWMSQEVSKWLVNGL